MIFPGGPRKEAALRIYFTQKDKCKECDIPPASVSPSQPTISWYKVSNLMTSIRAEGLHNPPIGVMVEDEFYIVDGHHRTAAQIALGYKTIKVRAVEVSKEEWEAEVERQKKNSRP